LLHVVNQARQFVLLMQGNIGCTVHLLKHSPGKQPTTNPESAVGGFHNSTAVLRCPERMLQHNEQTRRLAEGILPTT
jgi:hypothetical protein